MQAEKESIRHRELELQKQIAELSTNRATTKQDTVKLLAFVLLPQTRGINKIPILNIPVGTDYIALTLKCETNESPRYQAALRDPGTDEIVWKSGNLEADKNDSVQSKFQQVC